MLGIGIERFDNFTLENIDEIIDNKLTIGDEGFFDSLFNGLSNLFKKWETRFTNLKNIDYKLIEKCNIATIANEKAYALPKQNFIKIMKLYAKGFDLKKLSSDLESFMKADEAGKKQIVNQYVHYAGNIHTISNNQLDEVWEGKASIEDQFTRQPYSKLGYAPRDIKQCVAGMLHVVNIYRTNMMQVQQASDKALGYGGLFLSVMEDKGVEGVVKQWALKKFKNVVTNDIADMKRMCTIVSSYFKIAKTLVNGMVPFFEVYCKRCLKSVAKDNKQ